jgi:urease accessory protein
MNGPGAAPAIDAATPGAGSLVVERVSAASAITGARASAPLRILTTRPRGAAAWAYTVTFGGGLVAGDTVNLGIRVGPGAAALCATTASTKVYKSENGLPARQTLSATVKDGGLLALLTDPVCPFAGAVYEQRQTIELARGASLVLVDALVAGRVARGERYRFASYRTVTELSVEGHLVVLDATTLEDTPESSVADRMGRFDVLAMAVLLGPRLESSVARLLDDIAQMPVRAPGHSRLPLLATASPIPGGALLRVATEKPEDAAAFIRRSLAFLPAMLGGDPWARRW